MTRTGASSQPFVSIGRLAVALVTVALLSGCSSPGAGPTDTPAEQAEAAARVGAAALADRIGTDRPEDIDQVAREAVALGADLVAVERIDAPELIDPFGALTTRTLGDEGAAYCFRIEYDYYGRHSDDGSTIRGTTTGVDDVPCDASMAVVTPSPDVRDIVVLAPDAESAATEVLLNLPATPGDADDIAAEITSRLDAPTGEREVAAAPSVTVDGDDIGVAMGDADDCLLLKREAGVVSRVVAPRVLLQPGEYGCGPDTALLPPEALRSPH